MSIKLKKRNFLKKILLSLTIIPLINFNLFFKNKKKYKMVKNKNLIWFLNDGD